MIFTQILAQVVNCNGSRLFNGFLARVRTEPSQLPIPKSSLTAASHYSDKEHNRDFRTRLWSLGEIVKAMSDPETRKPYLSASHKGIDGLSAHQMTIFKPLQ
jgi:hypothetical protein